MGLAPRPGGRRCCGTAGTRRPPPPGRHRRRRPLRRRRVPAVPGWWPRSAGPAFLLLVSRRDLLERGKVAGPVVRLGRDISRGVLRAETAADAGVDEVTGVEDLTGVDDVTGVDDAPTAAATGEQLAGRAADLHLADRRPCRAHGPGGEADDRSGGEIADRRAGHDLADRRAGADFADHQPGVDLAHRQARVETPDERTGDHGCLLYTSDAADDL